MYCSFFAGSYGVKFRNGESTAAPAGRVGVAEAALDLFFIDFLAESLDCLAGDLFREPVDFAEALVAAGDRFPVAGALLLVCAAVLRFGCVFALDPDSAFALVVALLLAGALVLAAVLRLAVALVAVRFAATFFLAGAFFFGALLVAFAAALAAAFVRGFFGDLLPDDAAMIFLWFLT